MQYRPMPKCFHCGSVLLVGHICIIKTWYLEERVRISRAIEAKLNALT